MKVKVEAANEAALEFEDHLVCDAIFSKSGKTCYVMIDDASRDVYRKVKGNIWKCFHVPKALWFIHKFMAS